MTIPPVPDVGTAPGPAPSTQDTINFDDRADALLGWLPGWVNVKLPLVLQWIKDRLADTAESRDAAAASLASMQALANSPGIRNAAAVADAAAYAARAKAGAEIAQRAADAVAASSAVGSSSAAYLAVTLKALCDTNRLLLTKIYFN